VRADERGAHNVGRVVVQAEVVERELERLADRFDELRDHPCNVDRLLAAVRERVNLDQGCRFARSDALSGKD
jgi:uncharacterized protein YfcZ (UPF0381/DUF406 family)